MKPVDRYPKKIKLHVVDPETGSLYTKFTDRAYKFIVLVSEDEAGDRWGDWRWTSRRDLAESARSQFLGWGSVKRARIIPVTPQPIFDAAGRCVSTEEDLLERLGDSDAVLFENHVITKLGEFMLNNPNADVHTIPAPVKKEPPVQHAARIVPPEERWTNCLSIKRDRPTRFFYRGFVLEEHWTPHAGSMARDWYRPDGTFVLSLDKSEFDLQAEVRELRRAVDAIIDGTYEGNYPKKWVTNTDIKNRLR